MKPVLALLVAAMLGTIIYASTVGVGPSGFSPRQCRCEPCECEQFVSCKCGKR